MTVSICITPDLNWPSWSLYFNWHRAVEAECAQFSGKKPWIWYFCLRSCVRCLCWSHQHQGWTFSWNPETQYLLQASEISMRSVPSFFCSEAGGIALLLNLTQEHVWFFYSQWLNLISILVSMTKNLPFLLPLKLCPTQAHMRATSRGISVSFQHSCCHPHGQVLAWDLQSTLSFERFWKQWK